MSTNTAAAAAAAHAAVFLGYKALLLLKLLSLAQIFCSTALPPVAPCDLLRLSMDLRRSSTVACFAALHAPAT
jgi:hypothetical protein